MYSLTEYTAGQARRDGPDRAHARKPWHRTVFTDRSPDLQVHTHDVESVPMNSRRYSSAHRRLALNALSDAEPTCYWLDDVDAPDPRDTLTGGETADLVVVGAGYSGLWTALIAKQRNPERDVVLVEGKNIGWAASGRNGGFCSASLTHGQANGMDWYPRDMPRLERLGRQNLAGIVETIEKFGIDCKLEKSGELRVATMEYQLADIWVDYQRMLDFGDDAVLLDQDAVRAELKSPTYLGAVWSKDKTVMVDPARLCWGLADACEELGVRIYENSWVDSMVRDGAAMVLTTAERHRARGQGRVGHQRLPVAAQAGPAVRGAGVRLRDRHRAAHRRPARLDRLEEPAGRRRLREPVPLLPSRRGQLDPVGRVRRRLPLRQQDRRELRPAARRRSSGCPSTSSRRSRSWRT